MKPFILLTSFILFTFCSFAQKEKENPPNCGVHLLDQDPNTLADAIAFDRFGNWYTEETFEKMRLNSFLPLGCPSQDGFFELNFTGTFTPGEEQTICAVFRYLEEVIIPNSLSLGTNPVAVTVSMEAFDDGNVTTLATGSPLYHTNTGIPCGIEDNQVWYKINNYVSTSSSLGGPDALIRVNSNISNFHTIDNDPSDLSMGIGNNFDLFTVVLHEALHAIGFASRISSTGAPWGSPANVYSRWDSNLFGQMNNNAPPTLQPLLIPATQQAECCDDHDFNGQFFPNMPDDVTLNCDNTTVYPQIVFSDQAIAPVNAQYNIDLDNLPLNELNPIVANILSHLNGDCTGIDYVMHFELDENDLRREMSDEELDILCTLGYTIDPNAYANVNAGCGVPCSISLLPDGTDNSPFLYAPLNGTNEIPYETLLVNDYIDNSQGITVSLSPDCQVPAGITVTNTGTGFEITGNTAGVFSFCYEVSGCNGNSCDNEEVWVLVYPNSSPFDCNDDIMCDLVCWGDFEDFAPLNGSYDGQLGIPGFIFQPFINNTADIAFTDSGNQLVRTSSSTSTGFETIYLPLGAPIEPNCEVTISFRGLAKRPAKAVQFFASENGPCATPTIPDCANDGQNTCIGTSDYTTFCMESPQYPNGEIPLPFDIGLSGSPVNFGDPDYPFNIDFGNTTMYEDADLADMQDFSFTWINNTGAPVNFITLVPINNSQFDNNTGLILYDDFSVMQDEACCPTTPPCVCPPDAIIIDAGDGMTITELGLEEDYSDVTLCISGSLIIDIYAEWTNLEVIMNPGAEIIIDGDDAELEIYDSEIYGCEAMWQGIIVGDHGVIALEDSEIRDAQFAIHALDDARIRLLNTVFDRNFVGVYTSPSNSPQFFKPEDSSVDWNNNTFKCDGDLLPAYGPDQVPVPGNKSFAGIWLNDVSVISVFEEGEVNYFEGSLFGIIVDGAELVNIRSVDIKNLITASDTYNNGNIGIQVANSDEIKVTDARLGVCYDGTSPCTENLSLGIQGTNVGGKIRSCRISALDAGIVLADTPDKYMVIGQDENTGNVITARSGIRMNNYDSEGSELILIRENTINAQRAMDIGSTFAEMDIRMNRCNIDLNNWSGVDASGISLSNSGGQITIKDNELYFDNFPLGSSFGAGFELVNTQECFFERNFVNGPPSVLLANGFLVRNSMNNAYCCNRVNNSEFGVHFQGACDYTRFHNTTFGSHRVGLQLTDAVIGDQDNAGNNWVGANISDWDAQYNGNLSDIGLSEFLTDPNLIPNAPNSINVAGGVPSDWFTFGGDDSDCNKDCDIDDLPWEINIGGGEALSTLNGIDWQQNNNSKSINKERIVSSDLIHLYPNPTNDWLNIKLNEPLDQEANLFIYDLTGKRIKVHTLEKGELLFPIKMNHMAVGIYFYKIEKNQQILFSGKIVIVR